MCKCVLPPGVNPIAVDKYISIYINIYQYIIAGRLYYILIRMVLNFEEHLVPPVYVFIPIKHFGGTINAYIIFFLSR
jgi:hypothetical protein